MANLRQNPNQMQQSTQPAGGPQRRQPQGAPGGQPQMAPQLPPPPAQTGPFQPLPQSDPMSMAQPAQRGQQYGVVGGMMPMPGGGNPMAPGLGQAPGLEAGGGIPPGLLQILQQLKGGM